MSNKENTEEVLAYFKTIEPAEFQYDEEAIIATYQKETNSQSLAIKVLSVIGGLLASIAFIGFLFITGLYDSEIGMLVFGGVFIAAAFLINQKHDKFILDTFSVSFFVIGCILFSVGLGKIDFNENGISIALMLIAILCFSIVQNYILTFISVLLFNGSVLTLILSNNAYDFIHIYVVAIALVLTYFFLKESKIITRSKTLSKLYKPIRIGLVFSFIAGLIILGKKGFFPMSFHYIWLSSLLILAIIIYVLSRIFERLHVTQTQTKISIYIISFLILLPTALSPAISGAILLILLSFLVNYKTAFVIGILALIYFISQYYYDLNFTLLTKSILLFSSGVLFMFLYLFTYKKLNADEKI